jgi:hypothetical protein
MEKKIWVKGRVESGGKERKKEVAASLNNDDDDDNDGSNGRLHSTARSGRLWAFARRRLGAGLAPLVR